MYRLPRPGELVSSRLAIAGTLLGAACFCPALR